MNHTQEPNNSVILSGICQTHCPTRWCCSVKSFVPVPVYPEQIQTIACISGLTDFYDKTGDDYTLKTRENQYCIFFDDIRKICKIYDVRPLDCLIYPFDFYTEGSQGWWLIWNCPYSEHLNPDDIERILTYFETHYASEFLRIWNYANDTIDPLNPKGYRMLREMQFKV